jgi:hypothetical protein
MDKEGFGLVIYAGTRSNLQLANTRNRIINFSDWLNIKTQSLIWLRFFSIALFARTEDLVNA